MKLWLQLTFGMTFLLAALSLGGCPPTTGGFGDGFDDDIDMNDDMNDDDFDDEDDDDIDDDDMDDFGDGLAISGSVGAELAARRATQQNLDDSDDDTLDDTVDDTLDDTEDPFAGGDFDQFQVVAQSADTLNVYTTLTDEFGEFVLELPEDEEGSLFMITFLGFDSQSLGTVIFENDGDMGFTGLEVFGNVDLGSLDIPLTPGAGPVVPGDDADFTDGEIATDVFARLNEDGAPVGADSIGKGDDSQTDEPSDDERQRCDADRDGLIDLFDADDDGNGTVDDFDPNHTAVDPAMEDGVRLNFFMNLKIGEQDAAIFFQGDEDGIADLLMTKTVITFEVRAEESLTKEITGVRIIGPPAPSAPYLETATINNTTTLWSDEGFELDMAGENHFQQFVVPNAFINGGDTFTAEVTFDDGTTGVYNRMINYVFKSIPKLEQFGSPDAVTPITGPDPMLTFDGTKSLVLEWAPPVDEMGNLLVDLDYRFEVFFYDANNMQINGIDGEATWPTPPAKWDVNTTAFSISGPELATLSDDNTLTVDLPQEIFVDTVETTDGPVNVSAYKIDIASQNNGNNSALMLQFEKF